MPPVGLGQVRDPNLWFRHEQTYLERSARLSQVGDLMAFRQVLALAALRTGQLLRLSELARDAGSIRPLPAATAGDGSVVRLFRPLLANRASRLIKSPKRIGRFGPCGLSGRNRGLESRAGSAPRRLSETYVAQNLAAILAAVAARPPRLLRQAGRREVDFVIESGRDTLAVEVKAAGRWNERDLGGLEAFQAATPPAAGPGSSPTTAPRRSSLATGCGRSPSVC
jgi:predicted AAA+ superfamily ATPase